MMCSFCYVYAIVPRLARIPPQLTGLADTPLSTVAWQDLAAVTSPVELASLPTLPVYVLRHEAVVEALGQAGPTLPVRFGTVLADPLAVVQAIAGKYSVLLADLARLGDKIELGLTILWDTPPGQDEAPARQETLARRQAFWAAELPASNTPGSGTRYLEARRTHYRREAAQQNKARALIADLDEAFRPYALEQRYRVLASPRLAVRAAYLVQPGHIQEFQQAIGNICGNQPDLRWLLSGPWPPYTFVTGAGKLFQQSAGLKFDGLEE